MLFIFFKVFAAEGKGGAGRSVPIGGGVGCSVFTPDMVWGWGRGRVHGSEGRDGDTQTRPRSTPLPCLSAYAIMCFGKGFLSFGWLEALD